MGVNPNFVIAVTFAIPIAFLVLIVLAIRWLLRSPGRGAQATEPQSTDPALAALRQRFARGEIDAAEYEERKGTLGG